MKYNKAVFLTFAQGTSSATVNITVPILVKTIHCKSIAYITSAPPPGGDAIYGYVLSDLTQNSPLGIYYRDSTYPYSPGNDIEFEYQNPQPVQGTYTFSLIDFTGAPLIATTGGDSIGMILEFNE